MFDLSHETAVGFATGYAGKTLAERVTGKFYTPFQLADDLAIQVAKSLDSGATTVTLCDPFCGDGRFVVALMHVLAKRVPRPHVGVSLYDQDAAALGQQALLVGPSAPAEFRSCPIRCPPYAINGSTSSDSHRSH